MLFKEYYEETFPKLESEFERSIISDIGEWAKKHGKMMTCYSYVLKEYWETKLD